MFPILKRLIVSLLIMSPIAQASNSAEMPDSISGEYLQEVVVTANSANQRLADIKLGAERLDVRNLSTLPVLFGENDLIKSITLLPGVRGESSGTGGFEVRGGNASQNLIMLDGITLYNPTHVMGLFSTFNDNATGAATLYKGPIPISFGGATSSVLDTRLKNGDMTRYHGSATVGILAAKIQAEGPIVKDRLSFAVTARRSYVDLFLKMIPKYRSTIMNFYDVTAKLHYQPTSTDIVNLSFIGGRDNLAISELMGMHWGNIGTAVNWTKHRGDSWIFTTTGAMSEFSTNMWMDIMKTSQKLTEYIRSFSINEKINYEFDSNHILEFGFRSELTRVKSAEFELTDNHEREVKSGWTNALWAGYEGQIAGNLYASGGIRLSLFSAMSGASFHDFTGINSPSPDFSAKTYLTADPRISLKWNINDLHNLKAGISQTSQEIHSLRSSTTSFPFDRYALSSAAIRPERTRQIVVGYTGMTGSGDFDWSVEGYYKNMDNVYDYIDGRNMFSDINLESIIKGGKGRSYGAEFMLRKNSGRLTGWISYTLSKTQTRIDGINDGKWYDATNDRRNDISVVAIYRINNQWKGSATWIFTSGSPLTAPDLKYQLDGNTCYYYSQRNAYRTPDTHRLDLSATYTREGKKFTYEWSFGIYNAYCRYNPFVIYFEDDPTKPSGTRAVQQALFGIIPSISYTLKF